MPVAVGRGAAGPGIVAVSVVAVVRVASCSSGWVRVQQVGMGGGPRRSGGNWDLDLSRAFHCLERERRGGPEIKTHN